MTKPRSVGELAADGFWQRGPEFLRCPFEEWPIKTTLKKDEQLEGDLLPKELVKRVLFTATNDCEMYKLLHSIGSMENFDNTANLKGYTEFFRLS